MTDLYAVIGNPIGHSKSPALHKAFAEQTGQDLDYVAIEGTPGSFASEVNAFRGRGGLGLNITAPFKLDAFDYASELEESARTAGAVNCLCFEGAAASGHNFDGVGLVRDIEENLGCPLKGRRVLLLGAGGATRGALLPFLEAQPAELVLVNRTVAKASALGERFGGRGNLVSTGYAELAEEQGRGYDVVVNATSASLRNELPPIPAQVFRATGLAYELAYGKGLTPFLRLARDAGVERLADGVGMLVEQAAEAFALWRGVRPPTAAMIRRMTVPLT
jgi:shikimate dehydrogenase